MAADTLRFLSNMSPQFPSLAYDALNKPRNIQHYVAYMLDRTNTMFEWHNLPDTVPAYMLELYLQIYGYAAIVDIKEGSTLQSTGLVTRPGLYAFFGGIGGERDIYYRPTTFIVANPRLQNSVMTGIVYDVVENESDLPPCVLMRNDTSYNGLLPLYNRYAAQLVENDISIRSAQINARAQVGIHTSTDRDAESARKYLDDLEAGKLGLIGETSFLEGISVSNISTQSSNTIIQLIELQQYLKASWFNELGLNANFNMKREYLSRDEIATTTDVLLPLVDDMLKCREEAAELINSIFGTNISVEKSSAWASKAQTVLSSLAAGANEAQIGLADSIEEDMKEEGVKDDGSSVDRNGAEIQTEVQSGAQNSEEVRQKQEETGGGSGDSGGTEGVSGESGAQSEDAAVVISIEINNQTVGGEESESEAPEKSAESDSE